MDYIKITGARVNNLKNVDVSIPVNKITSIIGPSGSGKSSLGFGVLHNESKRRFLSSFPSYFKFFNDRPAPVDVDLIEPVLPVFGLPQNNPVVGTRSNVADVMQLSSMLQNIYSHESFATCPIHGQKLKKKSLTTQFENYLKDYDANDKLYILIKRQDFLNHFSKLPFPTRSKKSKRTKSMIDFDEENEFWEFLRFKPKQLEKLEDKIVPLVKNNIEVWLFKEGGSQKLIELSNKKMCPVCDYQAKRQVTSQMFSSYNALGSCKNCSGFGATLEYDSEKYLDYNKSIKDGGVKLLEAKRFKTHLASFKKEAKKMGFCDKIIIAKQPKEFFEFVLSKHGSWVGAKHLFSYLERKKYKAPVRIYIRSIQKEVECTSCHGTRLADFTHFHKLQEDETTIYKDIWSMTVQQVLTYLEKQKNSKAISKTVRILKTACSIGLGHLKVNRKSKTLSSGEYQRLLLLKYLSYDGTGALFIFDEPSLGLSLFETQKLYLAFNSLIEQGNTILLIEHDSYLIDQSDFHIEMGPKAGAFGGEVIRCEKHITGKNALIKTNQRKKISKAPNWISVREPKLFNRTYKDFKIPLNQLTHVTGASGSGKTSCLVHVLAREISKNLDLNEYKFFKGKAKSISFDQDLDGLVVISSDLNRFTSRSTIGSLTGLVLMLRKHYSSLPVSKSMGLKDGHFSANSQLGQCPSCQGRGVNIIEMQFLEDVVLTCEDCNGKKLKPLYADVSDGEKTFYEMLSSPMNESIPKIKLTPKYQRVWQMLKELNLDYLSLDRPIQSLSGGERQRLYLLSKLLKKKDNSLYIFENISFGLSNKDIEKMVKILKSLSQDNTVVIIDQSDVVTQSCDHLINFS